MKRVLLAGIYHETHNFVEEITGLDRFTVLKGAQMLDRRGDGSMIDGFLEVAHAKQWQVVPTTYYAATPSGTVSDEVLARFLDEFLPQARDAAADGIDAVFLVIHGAMSTESCDDVEGEVMSQLREVSGLENVPLFGAFDLHANLSERMLALSDALVCYRENPHTDARETAVRAARLLARSLNSGTVLRSMGKWPGIIWAPPGTGTADSPMRDLEARARQIEADNEDIWAVNVIGGYSFSNVPDTGVAFSVVTCGEREVAQAALDDLGALAWRLRHKGMPPEWEPSEALAKIKAAGLDGPAILVEPSDNIGGGAPGNGTSLLRLFVDNACKNAGIIINDPVAVAALADVQPGTRSRIAIGGHDNPLDPGPLELDVELVSRSDGNFVLEDLHSHMVASQGKHIRMGPSAVVRHEGVTILLTSRKTAPFDLGQWRSQGVDPENLSVIAVKAAVAHRQAYDRIAATSYTVGTPGPCASDPRTLPYTKVRRPAFPLDP